GSTRSAGAGIVSWSRALVPFVHRRPASTAGPSSPRSRPGRRSLRDRVLIHADLRPTASGFDGPMEPAHDDPLVVLHARFDLPLALVETPDRHLPYFGQAIAGDDNQKLLSQFDPVGLVRDEESRVGFAEGQANLRGHARQEELVAIGDLRAPSSRAGIRVQG